MMVVILQTQKKVRHLTYKRNKVTYKDSLLTEILIASVTFIFLDDFAVLENGETELVEHVRHAMSLCKYLPVVALTHAHYLECLGSWALVVQQVNF